MTTFHNRYSAETIGEKMQTDTIVKIGKHRFQLVSQDESWAVFDALGKAPFPKFRVEIKNGKLVWPEDVLAIVESKAPADDSNAKTKPVSATPTAPATKAVQSPKKPTRSYLSDNQILNETDLKFFQAGITREQLRREVLDLSKPSDDYKATGVIRTLADLHAACKSDDESAQPDTQTKQNDGFIRTLDDLEQAVNS